ncbi:MAG: hypothetical protein ACOCZQ_01515 [Nanoarchaeota archaeon]
MGILGRIFKRKPEPAYNEPPAEEPQGFQENQLKQGLQGFDNQPPSFDDDFTRNNFPGQGSFLQNQQSSQAQMSQPGFSGQMGGEAQNPSWQYPQSSGDANVEQNDVNTEYLKRQGMEVREMSSTPQGSTESAGRSHIEKDLEIISSKLDALKSTIENMDQRLRKIERIAEDENKQTQRPRW